MVATSIVVNGLAGHCALCVLHRVILIFPIVFRQDLSSAILIFTNMTTMMRLWLLLLFLAHEVTSAPSLFS
ncbi:hypothetical protein BKA69DRAFT_1076975 [Paraphysoderma sedebokerense]|nr:hypothetical protein BKA69DRAFT_1076975 [Paraphysoderma sedebokerense]